MCNKSASPLPQIENAGGSGFNAGDWPDAIEYWFYSENATGWSAELSWDGGGELTGTANFDSGEGNDGGVVYLNSATHPSLFHPGTTYAYSLTVSKDGYQPYEEEGTWESPSE